MRKLIALLALCVCGSVYAASEPSKNKDSGPAPNHPLSTGDQRGTAANPFVVQPLSTIRSDTETAKDDAEKEEHAHAESLIAKGTVALAWLTGGLFVATIVLAVFTFCLWRDASESSRRQFIATRRALRISKKSADASESQVKTLMLSERAHLWFENHRVESPPEGGVALTCDIKNYGRTIARTKSVWVRVIDRAARVTQDDLTPPKLLLQSSVPIPPNVSTSPGTFTLTAPTWQALRDSDSVVVMFGRAEYLDAFGDSHVAAFACRYESSSGTFVPIFGETYWEQT